MKLKKLLSFIIAISMISPSAALAADFAGLSAGGGAGGGGLTGNVSNDGNDVSYVINVTPEDAVVKFYDAENTVVENSELTIGTEYTYTASRYGYRSEVETVTLGETLTIELEETADFTAYGKNENNIAITDIDLPKEGALKWKQQIAVEFEPVFTEPVFINDSIYLIEGNQVIKRSPEDGAVIARSDELCADVAYYGVNTLTVGDGMIFVPVDGGMVQAINAETLESLWISEAFGSNIMTPLEYKNGKLYGGATAADFSAGEFFCIDVTDEDPRTCDEVKNAAWMADVEDGFYCSGAYVSDSVVVFGSDSGTIFARNAQTGEPLNSQSVSGAIRSCISYADGNVYFTSTTGFFHKAPLTAEGIGEVVSVELPGTEATSTPAVYDGLAYVGVKKENTGAVVIIDIAENTIAAEVEMPGYPQEDALISTNGGTYVYTTYNNVPGGIFLIKVEKTADGIEASGTDLFIPEEEQKNYCISNITFDDDGTLYYKNDSGYLFAVCQAEENGDNPDETLESAKTAASDKLQKKFSIFNKSDYSDGNYEELKEIYNDAAEKIKSAQNTAEINEILIDATEGMFGISCRSDRKATVYISVEKFNLGQGYIAEPSERSVKKYSTAAQVLNTVLNGNMIYKGSLTSDFYVSAIGDKNKNLDIPDFIKEVDGVTITENRADDDYLSEFDYSNQSGWVYTVNGEIPDVPASDYIIQHGDVVRFQFSLVSDCADIYSTNTVNGAQKLYDFADKDELTKMIATVKNYSNFKDYMNINSNESDFNSALITAQRPDSTQRSVDSATGNLKDLDEPNIKGPGTSYYPVGGGGSISGGSVSSVITQQTPTTTQPQTTPQEETTEEKFTDITDHWAKDYIYKLYEKNIITGRTETTFDPQAQLTRAECVVLLSRMAGADVTSHSASGKFADVADGDWFNQAIGWAADNGIVAGMSETEFAPLSPITREQFTVMLSRFASFAGIDLSQTADEIAFTDADNFSDYAKDAIGIVQRAGIINGRDDGTFAPRDNITRAETAKMLAVVSDK